MIKRILILAIVAGTLGACTSKEKGETQKVSVGEQIIEDSNSRYTSKAYDKTKRVSSEDLATIEEVLRLTPSSLNAQPWKFIVLKSDEAKKRFENTLKGYSFNKPQAKTASEIILFANKTHFNKEDFRKRLDASLAAGRLNEKGYDQQLESTFGFVKMVSDENGNNENWTKAQSYIALGNVLHALSRLNIDSTPMEGVNSEEIQKEFAKELGDDYKCTFALAIGYSNEKKDYNRKLPKARLAKKDVIVEL